MPTESLVKRIVYEHLKRQFHARTMTSVHDESVVSCRDEIN